MINTKIAAPILSLIDAEIRRNRGSSEFLLEQQRQLILSLVRFKNDCVLAVNKLNHDETTVFNQNLQLIQFLIQPILNLGVSEPPTLHPTTTDTVKPHTESETVTVCPPSPSSPEKARVPPTPTPQKQRLTRTPSMPSLPHDWSSSDAESEDWEAREKEMFEEFERRLDEKFKN